MPFIFITYSYVKYFNSFIEEIRHEQILVDILDAKTANVGKLVAKNVRFGGKFNVETEQADLAYHLILKDPDQFVNDLDEGDIVGLFNDESGETYIQPLRDDNIRNAIHAGVVSRSHWLAGHKPQDPGKYMIYVAAWLILFTF